MVKSGANRGIQCLFIAASWSHLELNYLVLVDLLKKSAQLCQGRSLDILVYCRYYEELRVKTGISLVYFYFYFFSLMKFFVDTANLQPFCRNRVNINRACPLLSLGGKVAWGSWK